MNNNNNNDMYDDTYFSIFGLLLACIGFVMIVLLLFTPPPLANKQHQHEQHHHHPQEDTSTTRSSRATRRGGGNNRSLKKKQDDFPFYDSDYEDVVEPVDDSSSNTINTSEEVITLPWASANNSKPAALTHRAASSSQASASSNVAGLAVTATTSPSGVARRTKVALPTNSNNNNIATASPVIFSSPPASSINPTTDSNSIRSTAWTTTNYYNTNSSNNNNTEISTTQTEEDNCSPSLEQGNFLNAGLSGFLQNPPNDLVDIFSEEEDEEEEQQQQEPTLTSPPSATSLLRNRKHPIIWSGTNSMNEPSPLLLPTLSSPIAAISHDHHRLIPVYTYSSRSNSIVNSEDDNSSHSSPLLLETRINEEESTPRVQNNTLMKGRVLARPSDHYAVAEEAMPLVPFLLNEDEASEDDHSYFSVKPTQKNEAPSLNNLKEHQTIPCTTNVQELSSVSQPQENISAAITNQHHQQQLLLKAAVLEFSSSVVSNKQQTNIQHKRSNLLEESSDSTFAFSGTIQMKDLQLEEIIGGGGFGLVYKALWLGTPVAVKMLNYPSNKSVIEEFAAEINLLKGMRHPNICLYIGACLDPTLAIVTELAVNGSLWDALRLPLVGIAVSEDGIPTDWMQSNSCNSLVPPPGTWPWSLVKKVASGMARGMAYLHSGTPSILHRDLKSANILLDESYTAKVCDFGLSRLKVKDTQRSMTGNCGTVQWMAPEVLANEKYAEPADVYSCGIILWELLSRECPYDGMEPIQCAVAVLNRGVRPEIPDWCPSSFAALITCCIAQSPDSRPTFMDILSALDKMPPSST
mmetsp:Transcript_16968/g.24169  ORF Transcript_16968/g.24169 Transcript_16968/m.24169 type:complete len:806 (-) Transcript_16968:286-2703(-)